MFRRIRRYLSSPLEHIYRSFFYLLTVIVIGWGSLPATSAARQTATFRQPGNLDEIDDVIYAVGSTYSDEFLTSSQRLIERDELGGLHLCWIESSQMHPASGSVKYRYRTASREWSTVIQVFSDSSYSSCNLSLANGRAVIAAINMQSQLSKVARETSLYSGQFSETTLGISGSIAPMIACDSSGSVYAITQSTASPAHSYSYFKLDADSSRAMIVQQSGIRSFLSGGAMAVNHAETNPRVVFGWAQTMLPGGYDSPRGWNYQSMFRYDNNLAFCQSMNGGANWNWSSYRNLTRFLPWDDGFFAMTGDTLLAAGDTFRFNFDSQLLFDDNNILNAVFTTFGLRENGTIDTTTGVPPIDAFKPGESMLWHWSEQYPDSFHLIHESISSDLRLQRYRTRISHPQLASGVNGYLYCVWTQFTSTDTSANGMSCGDIFATKSTNNGASWYLPINVSNTPANGGVAGVVHSETFATIPDRITSNTTDTLFIAYLDDRNGGSSSQTPAEQSTLNGLKVLAMSVSQITNESFTTPRSLWVSNFNRTHTIWYLYQPTNRLFLGRPTQIRWYGGTSNDFVYLDVNYNYPYSSWNSISTLIANTGSYVWNVNGFAGDHVRFRIRDRNSNVLTVSEQDLQIGNYPQLFLQPTSVVFQPIRVGRSDSILVSIFCSNMSIRATGVSWLDHGAYSIRLVNGNVPLAAWDPLRVWVKFQPSTMQSYVDTCTVYIYECEDLPLTFPIIGSGSGYSVQLSDTAITVPDTANPGQTVHGSVQIVSTGTERMGEPIVINSPPFFARRVITATDINDTLRYDVEFTPPSFGHYTGTIRFVCNAINLDTLVCHVSGVSWDSLPTPRVVSMYVTGNEVHVQWESIPHTLRGQPIYGYRVGTKSSWLTEWQTSVMIGNGPATNHFTDYLEGTTPSCRYYQIQAVYSDSIRSLPQPQQGKANQLVK